MSQPLYFNEKDSEVALTTKLAYKVLLTYEATVEHIRTAIILLDTEARLNFACPSLILTG